MRRRLTWGVTVSGVLLFVSGTAGAFASAQGTAVDVGGGLVVVGQSTTPSSGTPSATPLAVDGQVLPVGQSSTSVPPYCTQGKWAQASLISVPGVADVGSSSAAANCSTYVPGGASTDVATVGPVAVAPNSEVAQDNGPGTTQDQTNGDLAVVDGQPVGPTTSPCVADVPGAVSVSCVSAGP